MAIDAEAVVSGSASLHPYAPVFVEGRTDQVSGWWIVKSVTHILNDEERGYRCEVVLSTDSLDESDLPPGNVAKSRDFGKEKAGGVSSQKLRRSRLVTKKASRVSGATDAAVGKYQWVSV
jgi:hypothetical protein